VGLVASSRSWNSSCWIKYSAIACLPAHIARERGVNSCVGAGRRTSILLTSA
jgi:hypothetical protein